jgi:Rrf2 family transcriptional regulator, iron-sulfur cluster assembly transcription factor
VKLSSKGRYAVRALFDIAFFNEGRPTQVKDIAERQGIPPRFLEQIFQDLKRAGLVGSKRGPQGGYNLLRAAGEISVGDVLRITDGPVELAGTEEEEQLGAGLTSSRQVTESVFEDLSTQVQSCFDQISLGTLCERAEALGLAKPGAARQVYMI